MTGRWSRRRAAGLALAGVCLAGAGCGSTVPLAQQVGSGGGLAGGAPVGAEPASSSPGAPGVNGTAGTGGSGIGVVAAGGAAPGAGSGTFRPVAGAGGGTGLLPLPSGGSGSGSAPGAADGPGVSATTINVGDLYAPSTAAADAALGAGGLNPGDTQAETNAVVAYVNSHGGVAGRKLNVLWYKVDQSSNLQQQEQGACQFWTVDNKVFTMPSGVPILDQCIANAHVIGPVSGDVAQEDTAVMQQYPQDVNVDGMTLDSTMSDTVSGLSRQGYFATGAKLGILTWDEGDFRYGITHTAVPALSAIGFNNVPVEYITVPQSEGDLGSSSAAIGNAIVKFRSAGVDHVLVFDGTAGINSAGTLVLLFMNAANGQAYYPTYGLNSTSGLSTIAPDVPAREMQGSLAVGWVPSLDLSSGDFAAVPLSAQAKLCVKIMSDAGQAPTSQNAQAVAFAICDEYFFIQYALGRVSGPLTQAAAVAAINSIGTTFPEMSTFQANFTPAKHDGPALVRNAAFVGSCDCFQYTSAAYSPG